MEHNCKDHEDKTKAFMEQAQNAGSNNYVGGTITTDYVRPLSGGVCPHCGYCPACGRSRGYWPYWNPWYVNYNQKTAPAAGQYQSTWQNVQFN